MRKLGLALITAAMPLAAVPAMAQDVAQPFTGARVEGLVGWDRLQSDYDHKDGVTYGVAAGYDAAMGNGLILGVEGELSDSTTKACGPDGVGDRYCFRTGRDLYVGGRIGTAITPQLLAYAKAGYTNARYKLTVDDAVTGDRTHLGGHNYDGYRLGAGLEYAITPQSYVKAEYRYSNWEGGLDKNQVLAGFGFRF